MSKALKPWLLTTAKPCLQKQHVSRQSGQPLLLSSHRAFSKTTTPKDVPPLPSKWLKAYKSIPSAIFRDILPHICHSQKKQLTLAFLGDKLLGGASARVLFLHQGDKNDDNDWPHNQGAMTHLVSYAFSNGFLKEQAPLLIPHHFVDLPADSSDRAVGTAVEAAVMIVHEEQAANRSEAAIQDVAQYLLLAALPRYQTSNPKGRLLEIGARFLNTVQVPDEHQSYVDHRPIFQATAVRGRQKVSARGLSKLAAEEEAAQLFLQKYHDPKNKSSSIHHRVNSYSNHTFDTNPAAKSEESKSEQEWTEFVLATDDYRLSKGETLTDWWKRGANRESLAFVRALRSSRVFPEHIKTVRSWSYSCSGDEFKIVVMTLQLADWTYQSFLAWSLKSLTKARIVLGLGVNDFVTTLLIKRKKHDSAPKS